MLKRAQGIFISEYQKTWNPKPWQSFVDVRATNGLTKDTKYKEFYQIARDNDIAVGAVHYLRSNPSYQVQLDYFLNVAENADYYTCDFEEFGNVNTERFANNAVKFVEALNEATNKQVTFYSSPNYVQEWMYPHSVFWVRTYKNFWNAQWPYRHWRNALLSVPLIGGGWEPRLPAGCLYWIKWQYGAEHLGRGAYEGVGSEHVCLEVFNGTKEKMYDWILLSDEPETPPENLYAHGWNDALDSVGNFIEVNKRHNGYELSN